VEIRGGLGIEEIQVGRLSECLRSPEFGVWDRIQAVAEVFFGFVPSGVWMPRVADPESLTLLVVVWAATLVTAALAGHRIIRILFALLRYRDPRLARQAPPDHPDDDGR